MPPAPRLRQLLTLTNGHTLSYASHGDPHGRPLIYLHGTPSSRLELGSLHPLLTRLHIHLIAPDRPGIGLSTPSPSRTIPTYASDISQLASHLGWSSFDILGGSGGAPYVLACARYLPSTSLRRVGVIAGSAPPEAGVAGLSLTARMGALVLARPKLVEWMFRGEARRAGQGDTRAVERSVRRSLARLGGEDREACEQDVEWIVQAYGEALRQGSAGVARDLELMLKPWGFAVEDVEKEDVQVWCGDDDKNTPLAMSRFMVDRLPKADLHVLEGVSHFTIFSERYMERILREFVSK